jgi:hypothetical protein
LPAGDLRHAPAVAERHGKLQHAAKHHLDPIPQAAAPFPRESEIDAPLPRAPSPARSIPPPFAQPGLRGRARVARAPRRLERDPAGGEQAGGARTRHTPGDRQWRTHSASLHAAPTSTTMAEAAAAPSSRCHG